MKKGYWQNDGVKPRKEKVEMGITKVKRRENVINLIRIKRKK